MYLATGNLYKLIPIFIYIAVIYKIQFFTAIAVTNKIQIFTAKYVIKNIAENILFTARYCM